MTSIAAQLSKPLAQERRFCGRQPKGDMSTTPIIRPLGKRHEWRVETEERLAIVVGCRARAF
jgi:hypothetical protein